MRHKIVSCLVLTAFSFNIFAPYALAQTVDLPAPTQLLMPSASYSFPVLRGIKLDSKAPLNIEFIIDPGSQKTVDKEEVGLLIKYFLAALTIPKDNLWVNLSPYEQNRIVPDALSQTELGEDMLGQDYLLKQLSASLTYPKMNAGKAYWQEMKNPVIASKAKQSQSLSKVWITADQAQIYEGKNVVLITKSSLKALTEDDYLANSKNSTDSINSSTQTFKMHILPLINKEINTGKNFAQLRQIYNAVILGLWFKNKFKESFYRSYFNHEAIDGIDTADKASKEKIYSLYTEAFKKGVYDYIKTERIGAKITKRAYFSGGVAPGFSLPDSGATSITTTTPVYGQDVVRAMVSLLPSQPIQNTWRRLTDDITQEVWSRNLHALWEKKWGDTLTPARLAAIQYAHDNLSKGWRALTEDERVQYDKLKDSGGKDSDTMTVNGRTYRLDQIYKVYTGELTVTNCEKSDITAMFAYLETKVNGAPLFSKEQARWLMDRGFLGYSTAAAYQTATPDTPLTQLLMRMPTHAMQLSGGQQDNLMYWGQDIENAVDTICEYAEQQLAIKNFQQAANALAAARFWAAKLLSPDILYPLKIVSDIDERNRYASAKHTQAQQKINALERRCKLNQMWYEQWGRPLTAPQLNTIEYVHKNLSQGWHALTDEEKRRYETLKATGGKDTDTMTISNRKYKLSQIYEIYTGQIAVTNCSKEQIKAMFDHLNKIGLFDKDGKQARWLMDNGFLGDSDETPTDEKVGGLVLKDTSITKTGGSQDLYFENIPDIGEIKSLGFNINELYKSTLGAVLRDSK